MSAVRGRRFCDDLAGLPHGLDGRQEVVDDETQSHIADAAPNYGLAGGRRVQLEHNAIGESRGEMVGAVPVPLGDEREADGLVERPGSAKLRRVNNDEIESKTRHAQILPDATDRAMRTPAGTSTELTAGCPARSVRRLLPISRPRWGAVTESE